MTALRALALVAAASGLACATVPPTSLATGRYAMGTALELTLVGRDPVALEAAAERAYAEVERLEGLLSSWRPESDVGRLNAAAGSPQEIDAEVAELLARAIEWTRATHGTFDVSVGPLVALWREAAARGQRPNAAALAAALERVGPGQLEVERGRDGARARLAKGSRIDLGGIAKGYALDRLRREFGREVDAALLSFGQSSAWAHGHPPRSAGWRLLARAPEGGFAGVLTLRDRALSVSGSHGQAAEIGGRSYGHVIDPRDGEPLTRRRQALVVSRDATLAEALSKALLVLGESEGVALLESWPDAEALLLDADGRRWQTSGWQRETAYEALAAD